LALKPPENEKSRFPQIKGTGMDGTIFPLKEKAGDPSAWCWGSPAKGGGTD
jgi:hypothetical protein